MTAGTSTKYGRYHTPSRTQRMRAMRRTLNEAACEEKTIVPPHSPFPFTQRCSGSLKIRGHFSRRSEGPRRSSPDKCENLNSCPTPHKVSVVDTKQRIFSRSVNVCACLKTSENIEMSAGINFEGSIMKTKEEMKVSYHLHKEQQHATKLTKFFQRAHGAECANGESK